MNPIYLWLKIRLYYILKHALQANIHEAYRLPIFVAK